MAVQREPDARDIRYLTLLGMRRSGCTEQEIATKLEFGSPEALYHRLALDDFPICGVCGETHVGQDHCQKPREKRRRRARRGTGEATELPPAAAAEDLFRAAISKMDRSTSSLCPRKEVYRDERFETVRDYPNAGATFSRAAFPGEDGAEEWKRLCEEHGQDPDIQSFRVEEAPIVHSEGGPQTPPKPLAELISIYALADEPLEPLLRKLHPDPSTLDRERLEKAVEELRHKAGQLATLVRGGIIRRGPSTGELGEQELAAAWHIRKKRREGVPDKDIYQELKPHSYTRDDVSRLGDMNLRPPE